MAAAFLSAVSIRPGQYNAWGTMSAIYLLAVLNNGLNLAGAPPYMSDYLNGGALIVGVALAACLPPAQCLGAVTVDERRRRGPVRGDRALERPGGRRAGGVRAEYADTYLPLVHRVPHVVRVDTFRVEEPDTDGGAYRLGGMYFADENEYRRASGTPKWEAMFAQCRALMDRFTVTVRYVALSR